MSDKQVSNVSSQDESSVWSENLAFFRRSFHTNTGTASLRVVGISLNSVLGQSRIWGYGDMRLCFTFGMRSLMASATLLVTY